MWVASQRGDNARAAFYEAVGVRGFDTALWHRLLLWRGAFVYSALAYALCLVLLGGLGDTRRWRWSRRIALGLVAVAAFCALAGTLAWFRFRAL